MFLKDLYEIQARLKDHINYRGEDKFRKITLALLVEVAECANDWRGFKYWSKNQESKPTLLEEYVDGLHFVLEIGLDMGVYFEYIPKKDFLKLPTIEQQFNSIFKEVAMLQTIKHSPEQLKSFYQSILYQYVSLGEMLGFDEEDIRAAYLEKNKVNHERQNNGY